MSGMDMGTMSGMPGMAMGSTATTLATSTSAAAMSLSSTATSTASSTATSTATTAATAMATGMGSMGMSMSSVVGSAGRVCEIQVRVLTLQDHDRRPSLYAATEHYNDSN